MSVYLHDIFSNTGRFSNGGFRAVSDFHRILSLVSPTEWLALAFYSFVCQAV